MKCQNCPKVSTLQITEIHGENNFEEIHLCDECAQKYLYDTAVKKKTGDDSAAATDKGCTHCGTKFVDFRNSGRLGCPHDYQAFHTELLPLLESIHSATRHVGKTPQRTPKPTPTQTQSQELLRLRKDLQKAVTAEAYEDAARLRDRIRQIEEA